MPTGFISYSHKDYGLCEDLREHLSALERAFRMQFWTDKRIGPGQKWTKEIERAINSADVFIFLLSPAFFNSKYIMDIEYEEISKRFAEDKHLPIPILARDCSWEWAFGGCQALPGDGSGGLRAIDHWKPKSNGWHATILGIRRAIEDHFQIAATPRGPWGNLR
jgi:hypothetical protein